MSIWSSAHCKKCGKDDFYIATALDFLLQIRCRHCDRRLDVKVKGDFPEFRYKLFKLNLETGNVEEKWIGEEKEK